MRIGGQFLLSHHYHFTRLFRSIFVSCPWLLREEIKSYLSWSRGNRSVGLFTHQISIWSITHNESNVAAQRSLLMGTIAQLLQNWLALGITVRVELVAHQLLRRFSCMLLREVSKRQACQSAFSRPPQIHKINECMWRAICSSGRDTPGNAMQSFMAEFSASSRNIAEANLTFFHLLRRARSNIFS